MSTLNRRRFLELGALGGALGAGLPAGAFGQSSAARADVEAEERRVYLAGDGLNLSPSQYGRLLTRLADERGIAPDAYILGGVVDELEARFATLLGKERAVVMPTGTLANQLAIRALAGRSSRAIVQADSHIYQDSGDCVQTLSNITLVPLAPRKATFTLDETQRAVSEARGGRVLSPVSVISIETPVRRRFGELFNAVQMTQIVDLARKEGIRLHLDGARLFLEAAYTRRPLADYAKMFDTVYVSLYKYFNAAGGAILAGPRALLDDIYHVRRMYGGGLYHAWPYAAVALHYLEGFEQRYARAVAASEEFIQGVGRIDGITVDRIPSGTHLFRLRIARSDPAALRMRLAGRGIALPGAGADGTMVIGVNESWNRTTAAELVDAFRRETAA